MNTNATRRACAALLGAALLLLGASAPLQAQELDAPPPEPAAAPLPAPTPPAQRPWVAPLEDARRALVLKQPADARAALQRAERALEDAPEDLHRRVAAMRAVTALQEGRGEEALRELERAGDALDSAPDWGWMLRARAARQAARPDDALDAYQRAIQADPGGHAAPLAQAERADLLAEAGRCEEAVKALRDLLDRFPELPHRHVALYQLGRCELELGRRADGLRHMHAVWWDFPFKEEGARARLVLLAAGRDAPSDPVPALMERARELRQRKHWDASAEALRELEERVRTPNATSALENEVRLQRALIDYDAQEWEPAIAALRDLEARAATPGQGAGLSRELLRELLQRALQRSGDAEGAEAILRLRVAGRPARVRDRMLGEHYWETGRYREAFTHLDRSYGRHERQGWDYAFLLYKAGRYKQAQRMLEDLARRASGLTRAQYLYWVGRSLEMQGELEAATRVFQEISGRYSIEYYGYQAQNRILDIQQRQAPQARRAAPPARAAAPVSWMPPAAACSVEGPWTPVPDGFFAPRPAPPLGAPDASPDLDAPRHHDARLLYTAEARVHWRGAGLDPTPPSPQVDPDLAAYRSPLLQTGAADAAAAQHGDLLPALRAAAFLHDIGLHREARLEIRDAALEVRGLDAAARKGARPVKDRPVALPNHRWSHFIDHRGASARGFWGLRSAERRFPVPKDRAQRAALAARQRQLLDRRPALLADLKAAMMEIGDHHMVRLMRLADGRWWAARPEDQPVAWSEAYPRAFPLLVQKYAAQEGLNPYLLWALMTVESAYNPDSVSWADARGLLQVIPKTGSKVADSLNDNDFGPYDLLDPETSIRHGAWYFARLVEKFDGQEPFAIASYNGGPHNVQRWFVHKHYIPADEFVEEIPFDEARRYVKKVLRFLALFRRLYEDAPALYVGQVIQRDDLKAEPRY